MEVKERCTTRSSRRSSHRLTLDEITAQPRSTDRTQESEDQFSSAMDENEDQFSSAALSLRAEKILANAKKRLDVRNARMRDDRKYQES